MLCTELKKHQTALIAKINLNLVSRRRCFHLGLSLGERITMIRKAPFNDPVLYYVNGNYIALRCEDADRIEVKL